MASSTTKSKSPTTKTIVSSVSSIAAAVIVARTIALDYMPPDFRHYLYLSFRNFINKFSPHFTMVIYESNEIYNAVKTFLATRMMSTNQIHRVKVCRNRNDKNINVGMEINEEFTDVFKGVKFKWTLVSKKPSKQYYNHDKGPVDQLSFELMFHRKHNEMALKEYIPFILDYSEVKKEQDKTLKIFTVDKNKRSSNLRDNMWTSMNLNHPANFQTLAMDNDIKEMVIKDLDRFVKRRDYYRKVGKAWKRGYLLYGPPGTGKSSLIAAMANYLKFDIYDLELTEVKSNSELRRFLVTTTNRSILVVEDIDCSVELHDRADEEAVKVLARKYQWQDNNKITLSGFLNSIDGLWSSCGDERIIIFTTNRKDKLDSALLRPGRMDVHIHMSYCSPSGFRLLASNYLGITQHTLFGEIEDLIREVEITPAEVAEQLLKDDDPDIAISGLIEYFNVKKNENEEAKAKAEKEEELATKEMEK